MAKEVYAKIKDKDYQTEESFVRDLSEEQTNFLNEILPDEINHAKDADDEQRAYQLNEVYELLL